MPKDSSMIVSQQQPLVSQPDSLLVEESALSTPTLGYPKKSPVPLRQVDGLPPLGPSSTIATCPFCSASVKTAIRYTTTTRTHGVAQFYCMLCCCCLPYCMTSTRNTDHYCPNCQMYLGTYKK